MIDSARRRAVAFGLFALWLVIAGAAAWTHSVWRDEVRAYSELARYPPRQRRGVSSFDLPMCRLAPTSSALRRSKPPMVSASQPAYFESAISYGTITYVTIRRSAAFPIK